MLTNRWLFLIGLLIFSPLPLSWSQERSEEPQRRIELSLGEKKTASFDGIAPFASDETILEVVEITPGRVTLTGLRGGTTQLLYWKKGVIQAAVVEIIVPQLRTSPGLGPRFRGNRTHFLYEFQNSSGFDKDHLFQFPSYTHSLTGQTPVAGGRSLRSHVGFRHLGDEDGSIPRAGLLFEGRRTRASLGETNVSLSRLLSEAGGAAPFGSSLKIRGPAGSYEQDLNLFGGFRRPADLMKIEVEDQAYGANYSMTRHQRGNLTPDFANVSLFAYQPPGMETFKPAGILEVNQHLSRPFSMGAGFAQENGGLAATASSLHEKEGSFTSTSYLYLNHGLQPIGGFPLQNDRHRSQLSHQRFLKGQTTLVRTNLSHDLSLARGATPSPTTQNWNGLMEYRHQDNTRRAYGAVYQIGATKPSGEPSLRNSLSGNFAHPLTRSMVMKHTVGTARSDLTDHVRQVSVSSALTVETERFLSDTSLTAGVSWGDFTNESGGLDESFQVGLGRADLRMTVNYRKANLRDGLHQLQFSPSLFLPVTTSHWIGLSGGGALTLGGSQGTPVSGNASVQYRHFFGPGVERDPVFRHLFGLREKGPVEGRLFLDDNYNNYFEETSDRPLPEVPVRLDSREGKWGKEVKTGLDGRFLFPNVKRGEHTLFVDRKLLGLNQAVAKIPLRSFSTEGRGGTTLMIPVHIPKALLTVRLVLDTNSNGQADVEDGITQMKHVLVKDNAQNERRFPIRAGEGRLPGIDPGGWTVLLDPMEIPDDVELVSAAEQSVSVTRVAEYPVLFLFRPIRSLRGRVRGGDVGKLPPKLQVAVGPASSSVDPDGFYWIKDLTPGSYAIEIRNLPSPLCLGETAPIEVPPGPFTETRDLVVSKCGDSP